MSPIIEIEATASSNDAVIGAVEELPEEIRFLHECTDDNFSLGIRTFDKMRGAYETPSTNDRSLTDYGHATADSEMRHQQLEQRKNNLLAKLHEQKLRKDEEDLIIECDRLERQLENDGKVIDLVDYNTSAPSGLLNLYGQIMAHISSTRLLNNSSKW